MVLPIANSSILVFPSGIMPAAFNLICLICLFWYKLGYKEFDELVAKIAAERPQWEQTTAEK